MEKWREIEVAKDGFISDKCRDEIYDSLPVLVCYLYEGLYPTIDYVDHENFSDTESDLSKEVCKYWCPCEPINFTNKE